MDTERWDKVSHEIEAHRWAAFDRWRGLFQKALAQRDIVALDNLVHPLCLPPKASGDTPLEQAILDGSLWGVERLMGLGHVPSGSSLDTFFSRCVGYERAPDVLLDMWQAWLPCLEQQDAAFRGHALASFLWWARPYKVDGEGLCGRAPLRPGISWESLRVSEWAHECWDIPVLLREREGDPFWVCEGVLSPLQRAWLGQGTTLIERLLEAGASPHKLHPTSALPQWSLASMFAFLEQAKAKERGGKHSCPALGGSQFEGVFPIPQTALGATFSQPEAWKRVQQKMRVLALHEGLPLPSSRASPSPRF